MAPGRDDADRKLALRARRGDRDALAALYQNHKRPLLGFLRRMAKHGAEDLFQDTWMKVLSTMHRYDPDRGPFRAWLYRIASNAAIDRLRSDTRNHTVHGETIEGIAAPGPDPEHQLAALETERHLHTLLAGIGIKQRNAILLRHQLGFTYAEIGSILGVAENTAKTLVHRGIIALRGRPEVPS